MTPCKRWCDGLASASVGGLKADCLATLMVLLILNKIGYTEEVVYILPFGHQNILISILLKQCLYFFLNDGIKKFVKNGKWNEKVFIIEAKKKCVDQRWVGVILGDSSEKPVFGLSLEEHLRVTGRKIAYPIELCVCALSVLAMDEEGLFRVAGGESMFSINLMIHFLNDSK